MNAFFFCEVRVIFFRFLERVGYHAEQALSKWGYIKALHSKRHRLGVNTYFFRCKNFNLALPLLITIWGIDSPDLVSSSIQPGKSIVKAALFEYCYI